MYIAYIENDEQSRFAFEQIAVLLRASGFEHELCFWPSPGEALAQIPHERPDIIFVDVWLAGLDLIRDLRQHPLCKRTVIVGLAAYPMPADRTAALAAGCDEFLAKPVRYQAVEDAISTLLPAR